ncbi:BatD family protein [Mangrovimonas sp. AS39]|uniref:BatD family protein n=1 Tax=Mangrovimonas futianensis TaxID=2895523 RepID=UPI001E2B494D|nr:BatD family protein [Mangrovimonas futianensis]MCF1190464.1 BatD family protein [Mangrovimonas futianensis]MCF1193784.1 BatD family protein [Mangrovimonas futianensis]
MCKDWLDKKYLKNRRARVLKPVFSFLLVLTSWFTMGQVTSSIDSTSIKIGEQITYQIKVESGPEDLVLFPEGQSFKPLEMIESYAVDTIKKDANFELIKKYGLTQFDSGTYFIPKQKIVVGSKSYFTDSLKVEVNNIQIDTTKQGLYDIKPLIEVKKPSSNWLQTLLIILAVIVVLGALAYWFFFRKKPLTEEEKIALLPPYDRAKLALKKLEESPYLENSEYKQYYSELTLAIRNYLDEKVYDHALESTTDELINRLRLLKDGNQIDLSAETIKNLESILKRADLVKFAKSEPDKELAKLDRQTVDLEIDHVKEALPEPSEEEKLMDEQYKLEQERKLKRKKQWTLAGAIGAFIVLIFVGFGLKYGFSYVKDKLFQNSHLELMEGEWVDSAYGVPPVYISTPEVLKRIDKDTDDSIMTKTTTFTYGSVEDLGVSVSTTVNQNQGQQPQGMQPQQGQQTPSNPEIDLNAAGEKIMKGFEDKGATNILTKQDKYTTPNGAEGLNVHGTFNVSGKEMNYSLFLFVAENNSVLQQILITWPQNQEYAEKIANRVIGSIELKKPE